MPYRPRRQVKRRAPKKPLLRRALATAGRYMKNRYAPKGQFKLGRLVKDVAMVKSMLNVEKKRSVGTFSGAVGQVNGNGTGCLMIDVTPALVQGQTASTRNGNSVKMTGMYFTGQFVQQSSATSNGNISIEFWVHKNKEVPMTVGTTGNEIYKDHYFSGQIDLQSQRNQDHYNDYVCLKKVRIYVPNDAVSGTTRMKSFNIGLKLDRHLRWNDSGTLVQGQVFMIIRAANGNCSTTTANTSSISINPTIQNTGWTYNHEHITYYIDN